MHASESEPTGLPKEKFDIFRPWRARPRLDWPTVLVGMFVIYYAMSIQTLPFADHLWLGELPPLALWQIPKCLLKKALQARLIALLPFLGMASGSPSPDMIRTDPWAMGMMAILPFLAVFSLLSITGKVRTHRWLVLILFAFALIDGIVTFWFDRMSRLSIF